MLISYLCDFSDKKCRRDQEKKTYICVLCNTKLIYSHFREHACHTTAGTFRCRASTECKEEFTVIDAINTHMGIEHPLLIDEAHFYAKSKIKLNCSQVAIE